MNEFTDNTKNKIKDKVKTIKKSTVKAGAAVAVVVSLLAGFALSGTLDTTDNSSNVNISPAPIVMDIDDYGNTTVDDDEDEIQEEKGVKQSAFVKIIVAPLWAVISLLLTLLLGALKKIFVTPAGTFAVSSVANFGAITGLVAITSKLLFPNVPLKKVLCKKNLAFIACVSVAMSLFDLIFPILWSKYPLVSAGIKFLIIAAVGLLILERKKQKN